MVNVFIKFDLSPIINEITTKIIAKININLLLIPLFEGKYFLII